MTTWGMATESYALFTRFGKQQERKNTLMKKENAVIFGVTGVVVAAVLIGGGIYMKTERDRNLNADTASTAADSNRAEEVQKAAKKVCPSYEEDGVLSILKTLL